jgi:hypothetical protein
MKKVVLLCFFLLAISTIYSQETHTINGETLELKTTTRGSLDLLWSSTNGNYRFFVRTKESTYIELKNTKDANNLNKEEYKTVLQELTNDVEISLRRLKFTKRSLKNFISFYNYKKSIETEDGNRAYAVNFRLGFSAGITNNPFVFNPDNSSSILAGSELELYGDTDDPVHSGFFQARHSFSSNEFDYSTTELALGYRFRIIKKSKFNIYIQNKFATFNFKKNILPEAIEGVIDLTSIKDNEFNVPLVFGVGADIKVSKNSYITLIYGELFALNQENNGNFSKDISIGYKFNL